MAAIGKNTNVRRVSPLKPGIRGARNWATAQLRAASYSRKGMSRFVLSLGLVIFTIGFLGLWLGGFLPDVRQSGQDFKRERLMSMGFVVQRVDVMGEGRLSENDVQRVVGVQRGDYLFDLDLKAAQSRVENLSWVERAIVRRLWPNRIVVQIIERKPFALWQANGNIQLVDQSGIYIDEAELAQYPDLPLIVGDTAPEYFSDADLMMSAHSDIKSRVSTYVRHNTGRWDLILDNGAVKVKLPSESPKAALSRLSDLQFQTRILDREIAVIDLRIEDRITLAPVKNEPA